MNPNIQSTSIESYHEVKKELPERQSMVYDYIKEHEPVTNNEIAYGLNRQINTIVPRTFELRQKGLICCAGKRPCRITGKNCLTWEVVKQEIQQELF